MNLIDYFTNILTDSSCYASKPYYELSEKIKSGDIAFDAILSAIKELLNADSVTAKDMNMLKKFYLKFQNEQIKDNFEKTGFIEKFAVFISANLPFECGVGVPYKYKVSADYYNIIEYRGVKKEAYSYVSNSNKDKINLFQTTENVDFQVIELPCIKTKISRVFETTDIQYASDLLYLYMHEIYYSLLCLLVDNTGNKYPNRSKDDFYNGKVMTVVNRIIKDKPTIVGVKGAFFDTLQEAINSNNVFFIIDYAV
jgi:hypothetical protein